MLIRNLSLLAIAFALPTCCFAQSKYDKEHIPHWNQVRREKEERLFTIVHLAANACGDLGKARKDNPQPEVLRSFSLEQDIPDIGKENDEIHFVVFVSEKDGKAMAGALVNVTRKTAVCVFRPPESARKAPNHSMEPDKQ